MTIAWKVLMASLLLGSVLTVSAQSSGNGTVIRVQIRDSQTRRPLKGRRVQLTMSGMDGQWYHDARILIGKTGSNGVVAFDLKQPVPPQVDIVDLSGYPCSSPEAFQTREILERGVVGNWPHSGIKKADKWCTANPNTPPVEKQPSQVVFYVHPLNPWQNYWYTLLR
jgi:hypothetical protein